MTISEQSSGGKDSADSSCEEFLEVPYIVPYKTEILGKYDGDFEKNMFFQKSFSFGKFRP